MSLRRLRLGALAALGLLVGALAHAELAVPELKARVSDQTGSLSAEQSGALEQKLAAFEQAKGSQIAVLIVPSTEPETIEQYALRVAEQWRLGRKGVDDGALLLIAKNDRALRIEVGYGLEGALPDAIAKRIIAETITPYFQQGDFYGGIDAGTSQMIKVIDGEPLPAPPPRGNRRGGSQAERLLGSLLLPFMVLYVIGQGLRRLIGSFPASALVGGGTGLAAFLILGSGLIGLGMALFAMIVALLLYSGAAAGLPIHGGYGGGRGGGFGGGGGGFSGGGGGFGGGGASGRW
jgi:uncharacterized protein